MIPRNIFLSECMYIPGTVFTCSCSYYLGTTPGRAAEVATSAVYFRYWDPGIQRPTKATRAVLQTFYDEGP